MKNLFIALLLICTVLSAHAVDLAAGGISTIDLAPGKKLTVTTAASSTAIVQRYNGPTLIESVAVAASTAQVFGEYFVRQQFRISSLTGSLTYSDSQSTDNVRSGSGALTSGTIDGVVIGGTTTAAGSFTALTATSVTNSGLTSGRVPFASTGGLLTDASTLTFAAGTLTANSYVAGLYKSTAGNPADNATGLALNNAEQVCWEANPAGSDLCLAGTSANVITSNVQIGAIDGTAGAPSYSFTNDPNTGIISSAANAIGFVTDGTERWVLNASGSLVPVANASYDIGNGSVNPRDIHLTRDLKAGRHITAGGLPTMGACGTSPSVAGADNGMIVTVGTGGIATTCAVTFNTAWASAPACIAQSDTDPLALSVATTTTTVTVSKATAFTASSKLHVLCVGF